MELKEYETLLRCHDIRPTANRIVIANALGSYGRPLSLSELEEKIKTIDKSNIFRALTLFRQHQLVHVIEDGSEGVRYELCHRHHDDVDDDQHVHFHCEQCNRTFCMDAQPPILDLPQGFEMSAVNYVVKGLCPECSYQQNHSTTKKP